MTTKIKNIYDGWKAYAVSDPVTKRIANERATECAKCPKAVKGTFEILLPDSVKEIKGLKCSLCSCPLSTATRSKEYNCPLGKW